MTGSPAGPTKRKRPSLREEQKALTRERLVDAGLEVFAEKGFDNATVEDIVAAAGASRATFYLHFKNILELAVALTERNVPDVEAFYSELDAIQDAGDLAALRDWTARIMAWFDDHQALLLVFERIMLSSPGAGSAVEGSSVYTTHMPKYLGRWPESRWPEAELRIWLLVALMGRVQVTWRYGRQMAEIDQPLMIDVLTDYWARGLFVGEPIPAREPAGD